MDKEQLLKEEDFIITELENLQKHINQTLTEVGIVLNTLVESFSKLKNETD